MFGVLDQRSHIKPLNRPGSRHPPVTPRPSSAASSSSFCSGSAAPRSCRSWSVCVWLRRRRPPSAEPSPPAHKHTNGFTCSVWALIHRFTDVMTPFAAVQLWLNSDLLFLQLLFLLSCPLLFLLLLLFLPLLFLLHVCRHIRHTDVVLSKWSACCTTQYSTALRLSQ